MINTSILLKNIYASLDKKIITEKNVREHEAKLIFENITGHNFLELLNQNISLNEKQQNNLENIINSRNMGKPLAYVLREISFRNLDLYIDERVLIPRQETELLVEIGLGLIENIKSPKVLEI
ncbi:MAG: hypothetical protein U0R17_01785 [Acidimicrobiia bacterium]